MKKFIWILTGLLFLWALFYFLLVFPFPFFPLNAPSPETFFHRRVAFDLIDNLHNVNCEGKWVRKDYLLGGCEVSLGAYMGIVESKRAVPTNKPISFEYEPSQDSLFLFSIGTYKEDSNFQVFINGEKVFEKSLTSAPKRGWIFHHFLRYFRFYPAKEGGIWEEHSIPLSRWKGKKINVVLKGKNGFWGNPQVLERGVSKPNLIMIQVDALRADLVGKGKLPNIDAMAKGGVFFTKAHSDANWTRPSNVHQFFGRFNREMGLSPVRFFLPEMGKEIFYRRKFPSIPSVLKNNGYRTKAISDNIFLHGYSSLGIDFGFEGVDDLERERYQSPIIFERAVKWIKRDRGAPFFLFLDFNQTHRPYRPPITRINFPLLLKNPSFALYQGCALYSDFYIGKLMDWLKKSKVLKNTLIVLNADHGERFHSYKNLEPHGETLLEEEIRVPLIFYWKGKIKPASFKNIVSIIDIPRTTLSLLGLEPPGTWRGEDLSESIINGKEPPPHPIILEGRRSKGIIESGWKLIIRGNKNILKKIGDNGEKPSISKLMDDFKSLYPSQPEVFLVRFNVDDGKIMVKPKDSIEFFAKKGDVKVNNEEIDLNGKGYFYIIFKKGEEPEIKFDGGKLRFTQMEIPWGKNEITLGQDTKAKFSIPYGFFYSHRKGFTAATIHLLPFLYSPQYSPGRKGIGGVKSILIQWGYMKK